ncbi:MAG: aminotransferase class V-fold PLP-dependent enzyme, partial [Salinibacterium sp.]|nr:aminotransferase class V-fold PLP-dependent enzyme [Salinibacterium sp.]
VLSYLDGNSLGRPLTATLQRLTDFVTNDWGSRLIRSWDEQWMELPLTLGDRIGSVTLGAAAGQTLVGDSTTVLLYKLIRAAVDARPGRTEIVIDRDNFPTDRFILEGIAAERGLALRWIETDPDGGVTPELVADAVGESTALVVLSQVGYKSGFIAEVEAITAIAHDAGALILWDLCHSAGVIPTRLDDWGVDIAVGCSYKYLNGGPGAPAFAYVARALQGELQQPIQGWMGAADVFAMADGFEPAEGMRRFLSGTPPILGMVPLHDMLDAIEEAGLDAIRSKSLALTGFVIDWSDANLATLGVTIGSPRVEDRRGSHVTLVHPRFREATALLWQRNVIPDFRFPNGLRIGLSPLSTTFAEVQLGLELVRDILLELQP